MRLHEREYWHWIADFQVLEDDWPKGNETDDETDDELLEAAALKAIVMVAVRVPDACPGTGSMSADRMLGTTKIRPRKRGESSKSGAQVVGPGMLYLQGVNREPEG